MNITPPSVCVRDTGTSRGRGAYALRAHAAGETVELCPVILFNGSFASVPGEVRQILFNWGVLAGTSAMHCLALGYGSMYNHENPANMRYEADVAKRGLRFVAVRDIAEGEELTVNYNAIGGGHESATDNWFNGHGIEPYSPV
ncbi:SET domain-containing protein-lysine N-methyltransferase [Roseateles sp.]|uniref:SET domain-containing protein-lysine N-methyltransferase n=1 Tax=Roseateles sp. TaxID=1971397 RepID=UPI003BAAC700